MTKSVERSYAGKGIRWTERKQKATCVCVAPNSLDVSWENMLDFLKSSSLCFLELKNNALLRSFDCHWRKKARIWQYTLGTRTQVCSVKRSVVLVGPPRRTPPANKHGAVGLRSPEEAPSSPTRAANWQRACRSRQGITHFWPSMQEC